MAEQTANGGNLKEAIRILDKMALVAKLLTDPLLMVLVWRGRANVWQMVEQYEKSLTATANAVAILKKHGNDYEIAIARTGEVGILGALAKFEDAIKLAHWIRPHFEKAGFELGLALIAFNLGKVHVMAWELEEALAEYEEAQRLYDQLAMPHMVSIILHDMGVLVGQQGKQTLAQQYFKIAYPQLVEADNIYFQSKTQFNLAESYLFQDHYEQALSHLQKARVHLEQLPYSADHGFVDLFEARIQRRLHHPRQAEQLLQQALHQFQSTDHYLEAAETLIELAHLTAVSPTQENLAQGLTLLEEAAAQLTAVNLPVFTAWIQLDQAEMLRRLGRINEAIPLATAAQSTFAAAKLTFRQAYADVLLADCAITTPHKARPLYKSVLTTIGEADPLLAVRCWQGLGQLALNEQAWQTAVSLFANAVNLLNKIRRALNTHSYQAGFLESKEAITQGLLTALQNQPERKKALLGWVERFKATALADLLTQQPADRSLDNELQQLLHQREQHLDTLDRHISALHSNVQAVATSQRSASVIAHDSYQMASLADIRQQVQQTEAQIAQHRDPTQPWREGLTISSTHIHDLLDEETVLVAYYSANGQLNAITATHQAGDIEVHPLHITVAEVAQQWRQARRQVLRPKRPLTAVNARLSRFWQALIAPLESRLNNKSRLIILPHRALYHIPFAGLYDAQSDSYLIDRWTLQLAPSATILAWCQQQPTPTGKPLLVGYPSEPDQPNYLPGVKDEIAALDQILEQATVLFGTDATRENVLNEMQNKSLIHLAGHAYYNAQFPLESGMPLVNGRWLRAADLYHRYGSISGATVVLSGCETGRGHLSGADVLGLTSAFLYAGASSVIAGLWRVDDEATAVLMKAFYRNLMDGKETAVALQKAQQTLRHSSKFAAPYYWASFSLTGDTRPY